MEYYYILQIEADVVEELINEVDELELVHTATDTFTLEPISQNKAEWLNLMSDRAWFRLLINNLPIDATAEYKEQQLLYHFSFNSFCRVEKKNNDYYLGFSLEDSIEKIVEALMHTLNNFGYV